VTGSDLHREMDSLRDQLDLAFEEVVSRTTRVERRIVDLVNRVESQGTALGPESASAPDLSPLVRGVEALERRIDQLSTTLEQLVQQSGGPTEVVLDERFALLARTVEQLLDADRNRPVADLSEIERQLHELTERLAQNPVAAAPPLIELDQAAVDVLRDALQEGLAAERAELAQGLTGVRRVLRTMLERPASIDLGAVEEAARRAALPNAADIATLRREVEVLLEAIRFQDKGIAELRTTIDWIKERLLSR